MSYVIYPQYVLPNDLNVNSVTASSGFSGSLNGTASYALDADKLNGTSSISFATTGSNTFTGNQTISASLLVSGSSVFDVSSSTPALRVTQRGDGPTFLVEDSANPDTNAFVVDKDGNVGIGYATSSTYTGGYRLNIAGGVYSSGAITATDIIQATNALRATGTNGSVTASFYTGSAYTASNGFSGRLFGTASYALDADKLDGTSSLDFATTGSNTFTGVNTFQTSITGADALFNGNLYVNGTASIAQLNTVNSNNVVVGDRYISLVSGANNQADVDGAGILWASGSSDGPTGDQSSVAHLVYRDAQDQLEIFPGLKVSGSLTASSPSSFTQVTASVGFNGGTFAGSSFSGSSTLQIGGLSTFGGSVIVPMKTVTTDYSLTASTDYIVEFSGSNLTGTLPNASGINGLSLILKNTHTTPLYITSSAGNTIDGGSSLTVNIQYTSYTFVSNGSNWLIV